MFTRQQKEENLAYLCKDPENSAPYYVSALELVIWAVYFTVTIMQEELLELVNFDVFVMKVG